MSSEAFTFDYVRVTPDRQIGLHSHPQWELSLVICGSGMRTIGDNTEPMAEGEIILLPTHIPHVWRFDSSYTDADANIANISVFFESKLLERLSMLIPELRDQLEGLLSLTDAVKLKGECRCKVCNLLISMRGVKSSARVPKMIELLQLIADSNCINSVGHHNALSRAEQRLEKVRTFCSCNFGRVITLEEIAVFVGMNKSSFCTFMRKHTSKSFSEYLNDMRLLRALDLLRTSERSISAIAYDSGFSNVTYFNRLFRIKYGCTPSSIRKNQNKK